MIAISHWSVLGNSHALALKLGVHRREVVALEYLIQLVKCWKWRNEGCRGVLELIDKSGCELVDKSGISYYHPRNIPKFMQANLYRCWTKLLNLKIFIHFTMGRLQAILATDLRIFQYPA
jgi:hypothetical protein